MKEAETLGGFFSETRSLLREYLEARLEMYRLQGVKQVARTAGFLLWLAVAALMTLLILLFAGLLTGLWLSELLGSYLAGFGITTLIMIGLFAILTLFRRQLFVNPIVRSLLRHHPGSEAAEPQD